jgi:predicted outer membrane repeat protein
MANNGANGNGGAIADQGDFLNVNQSQFTGNLASGSGGAISAHADALQVFDSTFDSNKVHGNGGAVSFFALNLSTFQDDTYVGNSAGVDGGAVFDSASQLSLLADTISGNWTGFIGGGVCIFNGGSVAIGNTILFGNATGFGAPDIFSVTLTDQGGNLVGQAPPGFGAGTLVGVNPRLGTLGDNGGARAGASSADQVVQTVALLPGSPALGHGIASSNALDERGFVSPAGSRTKPSIGAFEPQWSGTPSANQAFVDSLYEILLDRPADMTATVYVNQLNHGVSPTTVALEIENLSEYRADQVQLLFQRYLHRSADSKTLIGFTNFLGSGGTLEQVAASLAGMPEFYQLHGGTPQTFVDGLYEDVLNRPPIAQELVNSEVALAHGLTRTQLAQGLLTSRESLTNLVFADFQSVLGRRPSPTELATYAGELKVSTNWFACPATGRPARQMTEVIWG